MKILCISDQIDPLIYSTTIKQRYADVDVILSAGDLPIDYHDFIISTLNKTLFFVFGNHHVEDFYRETGISAYEGEGKGRIKTQGAIYIDAKILYKEGIIIAGLGGSMRYNQGESQYSDFQMYVRMLKLIPALIFNRVFRGRFLDILLTHAPPLGIHDKSDRCHQGFKCFLWFMKTFKPKYLVHGHVHIYDLSEIRTTKYLETLVVNAYSHYIIDTGAH